MPAELPARRPGAWVLLLPVSVSSSGYLALKKRVEVAGTLFNLCMLVGVRRFELPTSRSRTVRSSLAELHPERAWPCIIRIPAAQLQVSLSARGVEESILWMTRSC